MTRYYDMDKLADMLHAKADTLIEGKEAFLYVAKWLELLPSADVVPKSEVEKIFEEIGRKKIFLADKTGKIGVVVKIKDIAELEKKYTGGGGQE